MRIPGAYDEVFVFFFHTSRGGAIGLATPGLLISLDVPRLTSLVPWVYWCSPVYSLTDVAASTTSLPIEAANLQPYSEKLR